MNKLENSDTNYDSKILYIEDKTMERKLLDIENLCIYLSIGKTQIRKILKDPNCPFSLKIGNRWYADKTILDKWIENKIRTKE